MPVPTNRSSGQVVASADLNAMATLINTNETGVATKTTRNLTKRTVTGNYTLVAADAVDMILHSTAATAVTITLPQDSAATIAQDVAIPWRQYGAGQIIFTNGTGATMVARGAAYKSFAQYAEGFVVKVAANTWLIGGDTIT